MLFRFKANPHLIIARVIAFFVYVMSFWFSRLVDLNSNTCSSTCYYKFKEPSLTWIPEHATYLLYILPWAFSVSSPPSNASKHPRFYLWQNYRQVESYESSIEGKISTKYYLGVQGLSRSQVKFCDMASSHCIYFSLKGSAKFTLGLQ